MMLDQNLIIGLVVVALLVLAVYTYAPSFRRMISGEGFADVPVSAKKTVAIKTPAANGSTAQTTSGAPAEGDFDRKVPSAVPAPAAPSAAGDKEGFADFASYGGPDTLGPVPMAGAQKPQGCYPRQQLTPSELLPNDPNSQWAQVNPAGAGDIQGKNFLSAGALIGVNTVGQSMRNANLQLRAEPPNPQVNVSPWLQSTIEPDLARRSLE
jgi:hypothetical protein